MESSDKWYFYHAAGWIGFKPSAYTENPNVSLGCTDRVESYVSHDLLVEHLLCCGG